MYVFLIRLVWHLTERATMTGDGWLKRLRWRAMGDCKDYSSMSLKRLFCGVTKKVILTCHWKGYNDRWHVTEKATMTGDWKCYSNMSLKRLFWGVTEKTILACHWKGYNGRWHVTEKTMMTDDWKGYSEVTLKMLWWYVTCDLKGYDVDGGFLGSCFYWITDEFTTQCWRL
jgi:hypothetical protein